MISHMQNRRRILVYFLWLVVPLLLWWALRDVPFGEIMVLIHRIGAVQLAVLILFNIAIFAMLSGRWWLILRSIGKGIPFLPLVRYRLAAFGVNYFTPGPQFGGEPLQVLLLHRRHQVPMATAASAVALDKLVELLANFTFLVIGVEIVLQAGWIPDVRRAQLLPLALVLVALPLLYLLALRGGHHPLSWLLGSLKHRHIGRWIKPQVLNSVSTAERTTGDLCRRYPGVLIKAALLSTFTWFAMGMEFWLTANFLGQPLSFQETVAALTAARIAFLLPMPGGLGTLEAGQVFAMQAMGFPAAFGVGVSMLIRARDISFGMLGLWAGGLISPVGSWVPRLLSPVYLVNRHTRRRKRTGEWSE